MFIKENYEIIDILINANCAVTQDDLKSALEVKYLLTKYTNLKIYQKLNNKYESQKKSRTFHKKSGSGDIMDARRSILNGKKHPNTFINVKLDGNSGSKRIESEKVSLLYKKNAPNFLNNPKIHDEDKNPFTFSYSKNAMKKSANASMQNLHNTATTFPQYNQSCNTMGNKEKNILSSLKDKFNLKATHFMDFIVNLV